MNYDFEDITNKLGFWLTEQLPNTYVYKDNKKNIYINQSFLKLEHWLLDWKKENKLNERIDASIYSQHIVKHSDSTLSERAYQSADYELHFLQYLTLHYRPKSSLFRLIDSFLEENRKQLSLADIVITNTGATRCKTNIRFTLTNLRDMGLVLSRDKANKRIWKPSIPGIIVLLNMEKNGLHLNNRLPGNPYNTLLPDTEKEVNKLDCAFRLFIRQFKEDGYLYLFFDYLTQLRISADQKETIRGIMENYIEFTDSTMLITANGINLTKDHKTLSQTFMREIFTDHEKHKDLHEILLVCYQNIISDKEKNETKNGDK